MNKAYKIAALAVKQRFREQHPEFLPVLENIGRGQVGVYTGQYDQCENVLKELGVPVVMNPNKSALLKSDVVFVNCSGGYPDSLLNNVVEFVSKGGYLVTSDWALHYVLEKKFPNTVRWNKKSSSDEIIGVEPDTDSLWNDVVVLGAEPQWWLWGSYPIEVLDTQKVKVEAASHDLLKKFGSPVVAASFDWGEGHVFHVISHFWAKRSNSPTVRHAKPYPDFLKAGMKLSEAGIERVMKKSGVKADAINFATIQSAATATELVAQLCVMGVKDKLVLAGEQPKGFWERLLG